ncbi:non-ribosomal peptide synthetase [Micromonospora sp. NPDC018662]|uniref:non-ribosomal peptide synthetase n=1 Tax=Micromonospora sp. NPDC018662 TaxID=3364238 RepID=UPI0037A303B5
MHEAVADLARRRPDAPAVRDGTTRLTYAELDRAAGRVAAALTAAGAGPGSRVAVLAEASPTVIAAVLGVLRCGAAYVPIDPAQPDRHVAAVLADADPAAVVVTDVTASRLAGVTIPLVPAAGTDRTPGPPPPVAATDPAYVIYTSGTTGEPKGVLVEHGQLAASTAARHLVYPGPSVFLLLSSLAFDSSVAGVWGTLTSGGCLVVADADERRDAERVVELVDRHAVTRLLCVPSLYRMVLDVAARDDGRPLRSLETAVVAGEALPETLVDRHFAVLGATALVNEYGPTEATVWASYHRFTGPEPVSVGRPVPGVDLRVLDAELRPVPRGVVGELFVGGATVARGYLGRPDATARAFRPDPFADTDGARMYRTGDLVRWNEAGTLDFLGRRDDQVKIRGHRVEPGAVETALRAAPGVREAVVLPDADGERLVAYVLGSAGTTPAGVRDVAADRLPPIMVPARVHVLDDFPRTANSKVDRARLRRLAEERTPEPEPAAAPAGDELTARVSAAWAEVLKIAEVPVDVNFFDLGGHSLAVFTLQDALDRHVGARPSMVALFQHTTVAAQTALIRGAADGAPSEPPDPPAGPRRDQVARMRQLRSRQGTDR